MITLKNALTAAQAHLAAHGPGHSIRVPLAAWGAVSESVEAWCTRRNLLFERVGTMIELSMNSPAPPPPAVIPQDP